MSIEIKALSASPVKLSRALYFLSRVSSFQVNVLGQLFGACEYAQVDKDERVELKGDDFYNIPRLEALGPVEHFSWKDGAVCYKDIPVIGFTVQDDLMPDSKDRFNAYSELVTSGNIINGILKNCEEKQKESIQTGINRSDGLRLIDNLLIFKMFTIVAPRSKYYEDAAVTVDDRAKFLSEAREVVESARLQTIKNIANDLSHFSRIDSYGKMEERQASAGLQVARQAVKVEYDESAAFSDYIFYYNDGSEEHTFRTKELQELSFSLNS